MILGGFWGALDVSWGTLGSLLATLEALLGPLGPLLGRSWGVLEASWKNIEKISSGISFLEAMLTSKMDAKINKNRIQKAMHVLTCFFVDFW